MPSSLTKRGVWHFSLRDMLWLTAFIGYGCAAWSMGKRTDLGEMLIDLLARVTPPIVGAFWFVTVPWLGMAGAFFFLARFFGGLRGVHCAWIVATCLIGTCFSMPWTHDAVTLPIATFLLAASVPLILLPAIIDFWFGAVELDNLRKGMVGQLALLLLALGYLVAIRQSFDA